jgi:glucosylceramidase
MRHPAFIFATCLVASAHAAAPMSVRIDATRSYQQMQGFGASLTDSSAYLMSTGMSAAQRQALMQNLFDPTTGIGLSFLRQPIGASDFALSPYTYDDKPFGQTDYNLTSFSIAHDQPQIIPLLQQARTLNPPLRIMGTPWSPPAWMKQASAVQPNPEQLFGGHLKDSDAVYSTYANYFVKYVQAYQAAGLKVNYISLQNEPWYETTSYPSMGMDPWEQARLVKLVGPRFQANNIDTKILAYDHNWDNALTYATQLFADPVAAQYFDGVAVHGYGGNVSAQNDVHNAFPNKGIFFTELSSTIYNTNFAADLMWDMQNLVVGGTRNWAQSIVRWNLALDANGFPRLPGGAPNCRGLVTINPANGQVTLNQEYYSLAHISKFVQPGAYRVFSDADHSVAFVNPDGSTSMIAYNDASTAQQVTVKWKGRLLTYQLPAQSVATLAWSDPAGANVQVWLTTGDRSKLLARQPDLRFVAGAWSLNASGNWLTDTNWTAGSPNGIDAEANFTGAITSPRTVYTNSPITVGTLRFNNASTYVIGGTSSLTLQTSDGNALVDVLGGTHKINLPLTIASNMTLSVAGGAKLLISDPVTINAGVNVTQAGSGAVTYQSTITVLDGALLNVTNHDLVIDEGDFADVRSLLEHQRIVGDAERDGGTTTLALFDNSLIGDARWPSAAIVGAFRFFGDINLDGTVNGLDSDIIAAHLGLRPAPEVAWLMGDANLDGLVSALDYEVVRGNLGRTIPEPAAGCVPGIAMALVLCRRRAHRAT